jgi:hypothetical protein
MWRLAFSEFVATTKPEDIAAALARLDEIKATRGCREATDLLVRVVGLASWKIIGESYYEEALHYYLGLLHAHLGRPESADRHIALSHTMPAGGGDVSFEVHCRDAQALAQRQEQARSRGLPPLLIAAMPRSASASLVQNLSRLLDLPVLRLSGGGFPAYTLFPSWVRCFLTGGALTHDHFGITPANVRCLEGQGAGPVFVLARDPRAAAASYVRMALRGQADFFVAAKPFEEALADACLGSYAPWLRRWLHYDRAAGKKVAVHWITFPEVARGLTGVLGRIAVAFPGHAAALAPLLDPGAAYVPVKANFVEGDDDAWRREVSPQTRERLWEACTPEMIALLELKP